MTERPGRLRLIRDGQLQPAPVAGAPTTPGGGVSSGYFDLALHPDFANNDYVYLSYTKSTADGNRLAVARGRWTGEALEGTEDVLVTSGGGARQAFSYFLEQERALGYAREAVRQALVNLEAVEAPAGSMPVVLGPGWPGVLLHEAVGHGLEGDFNRKGTSAFSGRIGEQVAAKGCTVVDDGTLPGRRGSLNIDDEGTPSQNTVLIEDGVLAGYMQDKLNARLTGVASTGNGRRESYAHLPMPRMTNTYMLAGDKDPAEILDLIATCIEKDSFDRAARALLSRFADGAKLRQASLGVRRKGRVYVINKTNPRFKARQG